MLVSMSCFFYCSLTGWGRWWNLQKNVRDSFCRKTPIVSQICLDGQYLKKLFANID